MVDIIFIADIILGFFVSFNNRHNNENFQFGAIASNNFKQIRFYFDLLSVLGIGLIAGS
jgi:hypothetical protein